MLDLPFDVSEAEIKKQYRKKSLMIHPDKFKHERGVEVSLIQARPSPGLLPVSSPSCLASSPTQLGLRLAQEGLSNLNPRLLTSTQDC